ncbi:MAG: hypothetical protein E4H01_09340 [Lysobacterales bacterium]|nr:MAG: hypothetical protein E4H01_09340 [Xanthomonadales bacterium]
MKTRPGISISPLMDYGIAANFARACRVPDDAVQNIQTYTPFGIGTPQKYIGTALCFPIHPFKDVGLIVEYMAWMPDATARERIECAAVFGRELGKLCPLIGFVRKHDEKFFKLMQKAGVIKKTGRSNIFCGPEGCTVWETPNKK